MIAPCPACKPHKFQDKEYGPGRRSHTTSADGTKKTCTVCGEKTPIGTPSVGAKKK